MLFYNVLTQIPQNFKIQYNFKILFTKNLFYLKNKILYYYIFKKKVEKNKKIIIFIDKNIVKSNKEIIKKIKTYFMFYKKSIKLKINIIIIKGGEDIKNKKKKIENVYKQINTHTICRHSYIIAIGGGAILDTIGFIAATTHRGINLIRIPTTTLAQNDSGVGVKNGINYFKKKNFIGTFTTPCVVINDYTYLKTLENKDLIGGLSEAIKVSLIKNKHFFNYINKSIKNILNKNIRNITNINYFCAYLHSHHIGKNNDPFEKFSSRPLDFGHWAAHKIEIMTKNKLTHGQAVAIGIAIDCTYSFLINILDKNNWKKIIETILSLKFNIYNKSLNIIKNTNNSFILGLSEFKEHLGGQLTISLLRTIGKEIIVNNINIKKLFKAIKILKKIEKIKLLK